MDWTVICQKISWEVRLRKIYSKLLECPAREILQKKGETKTVRATQH